MIRLTGEQHVHCVPFLSMAWEIDTHTGSVKKDVTRHSSQERLQSGVLYLVKCTAILVARKVKIEDHKVFGVSSGAVN